MDYNIKELIKSVDTNQHRIMRNILALYNIDEITADITYSCGNFYKPVKADGEEIIIPEPKYKFDVYPQTEDTIEIQKMGRIPLEDGSCKCIVYDPPFIISPHECPSFTDPDKLETANKIQHRFGSFYPVSELTTTFHFHFTELKRLLTEDGYAIVKIQDTVTARKQLNSTSYMWFLGESVGLDMVDKFVLVAKNRILSGKYKAQEHSRRWESYFLVFRNSSKLKPKLLDGFTDEQIATILEGFRRNNLSKKRLNIV